VTNLLAQGMAFLHAQRAAHMSTDVVYVRGVDEITISAMLGQTEFEEIDSDGMVHRVTSRDFVVTAADLDLPDGDNVPRRGDQIRETAGAEVRTFEVLPFGDNPLWRWSDAHRVAMRIHTKHVGTEAA